MFYPVLFDQHLYDGNGVHHAGLYPPLMIENQLTEAYNQEKALRPEASKVEKNDGSALALVWMIPVGLSPAGPVSSDMIGALVHAVDAGNAVVLHADQQETVAAMARLVSAFVGGGHA